MCGDGGPAGGRRRAQRQRRRHSITGPNPRFTADIVAAAATVGKLADLDGAIQAVFGHGQPVDGGAGELIRALT